MAKNLMLRYGTNPQQAEASVCMPLGGELPFVVLGGTPGYINLLDALNGWALVKELKACTGLPAAASFKHVSPSGVGVGLPLDDALAKSYFVEGLALSPLACAYARARGTDRMSSFGDLIAVSDVVDVETAALISKEVSDGIIAPGYAPEALAILRKKKAGKYVVLQVDPLYEPEESETRQVFGVQFRQSRHSRTVSEADLGNIVTERKELGEQAVLDLKIAWITLKYTQSNSVCFVRGGQTIGVGAGQQSRVHCVRLAGTKADLWYLRQHPVVRGLKFAQGIKRPDRDNAIDQFLQPDVTEAEKANWKHVFSEMPTPLTATERSDWLKTLTGVTLGSDAFFPFSDSIDRAAGSGARTILQPGGSTRDGDVIAACDEYGMVMLFSGVRLFHH